MLGGIADQATVALTSFLNPFILCLKIQQFKKRLTKNDIFKIIPSKYLRYFRI